MLLCLLEMVCLKCKRKTRQNYQMPFIMSIEVGEMSV